MRKQFLLIYKLLSWLILLLIFLTLFSFFLLESPSTVLKLLQTPLKEQGIEYSKMEGSLLTGFTLHDVNYQNQVRAKTLQLKIDFKKLEERILYVDNLLVENLEIEENFLKSLIEDNSSTTSNSDANVSLPFDLVIANNIDLSVSNFNYDEYAIKQVKLHIDNFESDLKKKHKGSIELELDSNVAQAKFDAKIVNEAYVLRANIEGEQSFINRFLKENNVTLKSNPKVEMLVNGDMKALDYELEVKELFLKQNEYTLRSKDLNSKGHYDLETEDLNANLLTVINSNVAKFKINAKTEVNLKDINSSLHFDAKLHLAPKTKLFMQEFQEQNITLESLPYVDFIAKGNMKKTQFDLTLKGLKMRQNELALNLKDLNLKGDVSPLEGDTKVKLLTHFDSSVASGKVEGKTSLNFNDLNNTLKFDIDSQLDIETAYVNKFLVDSNVTLSGETPLSLTARGNMDALKVKLLTTSHLLTEGILSKIKLETNDVAINLKKEHIVGNVLFDSSAKNIALNLKSDFSGNYMNVEKLKTNTQINLLHFDAFGVNLSSLTPLNVKVNKNQNSALLTLNSKKIQLEARSNDLNSVTFQVNTGNIYPYKIVEVPPELDKKFIKLNLQGSGNIADAYLTLKGTIESNKKFKVNIDAVNDANGLNARLFSKELKISAKGDLKNKKIEAKIDIDSLKRVQKEFNLLYAFDIFPVEGAVHANAHLNGEKVKLTLQSPKLKFEGFNVEKVDINADYVESLININKLSFNTTGFKNASLNQNYYLNKKGFVHLGEKRDLLLDMHPKILIKGQGDSQNLKARVEVEALPLGHPEYGDMLLSCDIDYLQSQEKKKITGGIFIDKLNLFYESKYLDPSFDNDVIVLTKKDKGKKKTKDSFLEDTFIDIAIFAPDAKYVTRDIKLGFTVNVKAKKKFGKTLRMLGKVEEINGRVIQAPKLFMVVDSNIVFRGAKEINPLLDLQVDYELPDVLITIGIHGNAKRPKLTFSSNPPLPKKDILSYLLLGVSTASLGEGKGSLGREAQLFIMNQAARDLAYEVELDRVLIKDDGTGEGYAVQVGKKVQKDTMVIIENSKEGNSFILEYDVSKNIKVEVGQHQKTIPSQSIDIYFRKRFK